MLLKVGIPNLVCECNSGRRECHIPFSGHFDLDL